MSKTHLFIPLMRVTVHLPHKLLCYITFSVFCIMGTYFGLHRYSLGGMTALSCMLSTFAAGLLGGLMHNTVAPTNCSARRLQGR